MRRAHGLVDTHKNRINADLLTFLKTEVALWAQHGGWDRFQGPSRSGFKYMDDSTILQKIQILFQSFGLLFFWWKSFIGEKKTH